MKLQKIAIFSLGISLIPVLAGCESKDDPNVAWLLSYNGWTANGPTTKTPNPDGTTTTTTDGNNTAVATNDAPAEPVNFAINTTLISGNSDFLFDNTSTIRVGVIVVDPFNPATGALVKIVENNEATGVVIFSAVADAEGNVQGSFTINKTTTSVRLMVTYQGQTYYRDYDVEFVRELVGRVTLAGYLSEYVISDRDGDGVPDDQDAFPDDATRATTIKLPSDGGSYTVAFEDLYPVPGDSVFNDYVATVRYEEDLNARGEVVRIRGTVTHMARGAGYKHTLMQKFQGADYSYTLQRYHYNGNLELDESGTRLSGEGLEVLPRSNTTIPASNTRANSTAALKVGKNAQYEIVFNTPVALTTLGGAPFDLYLNVLTTGEEVHFPGRYQRADGSDRYLDTNGFPWAVMIPGAWHWPLEREDIHNAYPEFDDWYLSRGTVSSDWYLRSVPQYIFPF